MAFPPDGKVVVAGQTNAPAGSSPKSFAVARFEAMGALDPSFDTDGTVYTVLATGFAQVDDVAIQADGKIVLAV